MTAADVTGHFMPTADGTWKWLDGSVLKAWNGNGTTGGRAAAADKARRFSVRSFMAFDRLRESGMDLERAAFLIFGNHSKDVLDAIRVDAVSKRAPKKAS
ncbi:MAG: hypothetical protein EBY80_12805 [Actinobacteria bacterium]|nr:hypothetical protein [Actinomycetota bacterium]